MDRILKGEKPEEMETAVISDPAHMEMIINTAVADAIGLELPAEVISQAKEIISE